MENLVTFSLHFHPKHTTMKFLFILSFVCLAATAQAQDPLPKLSKDSARYYLRELDELRLAPKDSLENSDRYKQLVARLIPANRKIIRVELLAHPGAYINDFTKIYL